MRRREFVKTAVAVGGASVLGSQGRRLLLQAQEARVPPDPEVKRVLAMFKCHFDAGFIDTQANVIQRYFSDYFPRAITVAEEMRKRGENLYVWTTGSWLLYEYLEQAGPEEGKRMEDAISRGDIAWHALPFNWQTELMDESMIAGSLALSAALDQRFGRKTTGAKMTDVPGHTRGLIAPLAAHGVTFLDIGVNGGSRPAEVPELFVWKDPRGASLTVMYHHEYGDVVRVSGSDLAIAIVVRDDNSGPHTPEEIERIYADLRERYPNAEVKATNLSVIANEVQNFRGHLPVMTQEIGDTWIYGVASDPMKVARYREVARLRRKWLGEGKFQLGDATDVALLRRVLLEAEHTWGTDTKTWLDFEHYAPKDLAKMLATKNYEVVQFSWKEKRQDLYDGIAALPQPLRKEAETVLEGLTPKEPRLVQGSLHAAQEEIETEHFLLALDSETGAIHRLRNKESGREWASPDHPLALFSYQTLSEQDYERFFDNYIISKADWVAKDFGKPNIGKFGAKSANWYPTLTSLSVAGDSEGHRVLAALEIRDAEALESGLAAFPRKMYLELYLPVAEPRIDLSFYWFQKSATRFPEALWLTFHPIAGGAEGWTMEKSGQEVSPIDVVPSGSRHLHAVSTGFRYQDQKGIFAVETMDAPLIALGERSPLNFSRSQPDLSRGIHCNLFNNAWGTNYILWFREDMRFRMMVRA
ncbi:MAG TPA: DUF5054 domain-containing protein [Terriglobales bacterium]|nr:DUF5054 domain-containing protein [Terriglobales bacterium]